MIVDSAGGGKSGCAPNEIEETLTRDRLAFGFGEQAQHGEFFGCKIKRLTAFVRRQLHEVNANIAHRDGARDAAIWLASAAAAPALAREVPRC